MDRTGDNCPFSFLVHELVSIKQSFQNVPAKQRMHSSTVEVVTKPVEC